MTVDPADRAALAAHGRALADGIEAALPGWVERSVARVLDAWGGPIDRAAATTAAHQAGVAARDDVAPAVRALLTSQPEDQATSPLAVVRRAVRYPTDVLRALGVPPVVRDEMAQRHFPDDDYDLVIASFADLDPALREPGLVWGAAKAYVHRALHQS